MARMHDERGKIEIEPNDVDQIAGKPKQLGSDQPNVCIPRQKNVRPDPNKNCGEQV